MILEPLTIYESNVITSLNDLERALDKVPSPYLVGMCDLAVPYTTGEPAAEYVRRVGVDSGIYMSLTTMASVTAIFCQGMAICPLKESSGNQKGRI